MIRCFCHIAVCLLFIILSEGCCKAQDRVFRNISVYTQQDGLSGSNIRKIIQDKYDFLWIATQDGLNRFDGTEFTVYTKGLARKRALLSNDIRDIILDSAQNLVWVICNYGGINAIDIVTGDVKRSLLYRSLKTPGTWRTCAVMADKKIYIGSTEGLEAFNTATFQFESIDLGTRPVKDSADVRTINTDHRGNLWLGLNKSGWIIFDPTRQKVLKKISAKLFDGKTAADFWPLCSSFSRDSVGWLSTSGGLFRLKYDENYNVSLLANDVEARLMAKHEIKHIANTGTDDLIIPCNGLVKYNVLHKTIQEINPANQQFIPWIRNITHCFEDKQKNLWLGCLQGLAVLKSTLSPFFPVRDDEMHKLGHVFAVCPLTNSRTLAGTAEGMFLIDGKTFKKIYEGKVQNIFRLNEKYVVVSGAAGVHLYRNGVLLRPDNIYKNFKDYVRWQFNSVGHINDSIAVLGTESNDGIIVWNKKHNTFKSLRKPEIADDSALASDVVNTVFITSRGRAVILSDYGLSIFNHRNNTFENKIFRDEVTGMPMGVFMEMDETKEHYWINAYGEGLLKLDKDFRLIKKYTIKDGLSNAGLYEIFNYNDSLLFLTSNFGILVFNTRTELTRNYFEEDGLQSNIYEEASGDTLDGFFYAGGANGFVKMDPRSFHKSSALPNLYIKSLVMHKPENVLNDTSNLEASSFVIDKDVLQATITFVGIDYADPGMVRYAYRILEKGDEWRNLGSVNSIPLIDFSPGKHHLEVKASNRDGGWSLPKKVILDIIPKWHQTKWFKTLLILAVAALVYLLYRYRLSQIQKQHEIRKNIATDLHDNLGSTLNSVKIFANLAASGVQPEYNLRQVTDSIKQSTASLRDLLWILDDSMDTMDELVTRLSQFATPVCSAVNINISIKADYEVRKKQLAKEEKQNFFLICKEAINNSIKYSGATQIDIHIKNRGKKPAVFIKDNGYGFDVSKVKEGYGLKNMQYRASQIRYRVLITSTIGQGTDIQVVPAK